MNDLKLKEDFFKIRHRQVNKGRQQRHQQARDQSHQLCHQIDHQQDRQAPRNIKIWNVTNIKSYKSPSASPI